MTFERKVQPGSVFPTVVHSIQQLPQSQQQPLLQRRRQHLNTSLQIQIPLNPNGAPVLSTKLVQDTVLAALKAALDDAATADKDAGTGTVDKKDAGAGPLLLTGTAAAAASAIAAAAAALGPAAVVSSPPPNPKRHKNNASMWNSPSP